MHTMQYDPGSLPDTSRTEHLWHLANYGLWILALIVLGYTIYRNRNYPVRAFVLSAIVVVFCGCASFALAYIH